MNDRLDLRRRKYDANAVAVLRDIARIDPLECRFVLRVTTLNGAGKIAAQRMDPTIGAQDT